MTKQEVLTWLAEVLDEPPGSIQENSLRAEILGWDSLGVLSLMAALDERFDIQLSEQELGELQSVQDVFELLSKHAALAA